MRNPVARIALSALALLIGLSGCARDWPDEFPEPYTWQRRSAPLDLFDGRVGVASAASVYAAERPPFGPNEQEEVRSDRRVPSRLDAVCIDEFGDGFGSLHLNLILSKPVLEKLHPRTWQGWNLGFHTPDDVADIYVNFETDASDTVPRLDQGFIPYLDSRELVGEVFDNFRAFAGRDDATLRIRADFAEEAKPSIDWEFDLGPESRAEEYLRDLVEACGEPW